MRFKNVERSWLGFLLCLGVVSRVKSGALEVTEDGQILEGLQCSDYTSTTNYGPDGLPIFRPLIIAHRGSSGMYPEHTALGYRKAAEQGADLIECDLAVTKNMRFVCAHEPWMSKNTDIANKTEFASRKQTYNMDDDDDSINWNDKGDVTDWFSFDFTLEELKTLRKNQSQIFRDPRYDFEESFVTIEELAEITKEYGEKQGRTIGMYVEIKHPAATNKIWKKKGINMRIEDLVLETLKNMSYDSHSSPIYLQSFELSSLEYVRDKTELKLVFLLERELSQAEWQRIDSLNLTGLGFDKGGLVTKGEPDKLGRGYSLKTTTDFIEQIHNHGLKAHGFTFRNEWMKLYWNHGQDPYSQLKEFLDLGIDGYFTDFPLTARRFLKYENRLCNSSNGISLSMMMLVMASSLINAFS